MTRSEVADALLALWDTGGQVERVDLPDMEAAYGVTANIRARREARGERVVGRKIGFSNSSIWPRYGVDGPMWGYVWDTTYTKAPSGRTEVDATRWPEPRIEPEIVLRLGAEPDADMDERELVGCIDALASGLEIVQSVFPGWRFSAPMATASFGLHGRLVSGAWVPMSEDWLARLEGVQMTLLRKGVAVERGSSANVLGSPVKALRHLVRTLATDGAPPLQAGEVVTTGTMTDAWPIASGEAWEMRFDDDALPALGVTFR